MKFLLLIVSALVFSPIPRIEPVPCIAVVGSRCIPWTLKFRDSIAMRFVKNLRNNSTTPESKSPTATPTVPIYQENTYRCKTEACSRILPAGGQARVIVSVENIRPTPKDWPFDKELERQYRQDVAASIDRVLQSLKLKDKNYVTTRFETIPAFAMTADQETLDALAVNPNILAIEEDKVGMPF